MEEIENKPPNEGAEPEDISDEELARRMRHDAINKKFQETLLKALKKSGMVVDTSQDIEISKSEDKKETKDNHNAPSVFDPTNLA